MVLVSEGKEGALPLDSRIKYSFEGQWFRICKAGLVPVLHLCW